MAVWRAFLPRVCADEAETDFHSSCAQFSVALVVYSTLSLLFPAKETFIPEAITSDDHDIDTPGSEKSSHWDKRSVEEEVKVVV